jgi:hypothetical protein
VKIFKGEFFVVKILPEQQTLIGVELEVMLAI